MVSHRHTAESCKPTPSNPKTLLPTALLPRQPPNRLCPIAVTHRQLLVAEEGVEIQIAHHVPQHSANRQDLCSSPPNWNSMVPSNSSERLPKACVGTGGVEAGKRARRGLTRGLEGGWGRGGVVDGLAEVWQVARRGPHCCPTACGVLGEERGRRDD